MESIHVGSEIELTIDGLTFGDGVGRFDGRVCFVEGALPGERVRAKVSQVKKRYLRGCIVAVLEASPHRENPPCPYVDECGGCQYQHLAYAEELRWKERQVREALERIGKVGVGDCEPIVGSLKPYGYRSTVTLHQGQLGDRRAWGFYAKDNKSIIEIERCLIADDRLNAFVGAGFSAGGGPTCTTDVPSIALKVSADDTVVSDIKETFFKMSVLGREFWVSSRGFFQTNIPVTERIVEKVKGWLLDYDDFELYDLYAGTGLFSVLCGDRAKKVYAVESYKSNIKALRRNFQGVEKRGYKIVPGTVEKRCGELLHRSPERPRVVILDPPREGLAHRLATDLAARRNVDALIYISCDPAHLARDLRILLAKGSYRLASVAPFDMFPRTKHIEVVARLEAVKPSI